MTRIAIGVGPAVLMDRFKPLLTALEAVFPVAFVARGEGDAAGLSAWVLLGVPASGFAGCVGLPTFAVLPPVGPAQRGGGAGIRLGTQAVLSACLRGQALADAEDEELPAIAVLPGDEVLAARGDRPIWVYRPSDGVGLHLVALAPPVLAEGEALRSAFNGRCFLRLLPLLHFLKALTRGRDQEELPLRACFVFDDPSLRRPSYGCLDYRQLAEHARTHDYHAAIATIPMDAGRVSEAVSGLFRKHEAQLSLLIHGNNHAWLEFARPRRPEQNLALLAQALRRVRDCEERTGLRVSRVMEPPFGVLELDVLEPLARLGYEAVLIDPEQFLHWNRLKPLAPFVGLGVAHWPAGGLCCIPRIRVASRWWKNEVVLAALMGLPIVIAGHHYDAENGMNLLAEVAATVNGLGRVLWSDLADIARASYSQCRDGDRVQVRMGSRRILFPVPAGVRTLVVERPWLGGREEPLRIAGHSTFNLVVGGLSEPIPVQGPATVEIASFNPEGIDPMDVPEPGRALWPMARRLFTETRDRLYPFLHRTAR